MNNQKKINKLKAKVENLRRKSINLREKLIREEAEIKEKKRKFLATPEGLGILQKIRSTNQLRRNKTITPSEAQKEHYKCDKQIGQAIGLSKSVWVYTSHRRIETWAQQRFIEFEILNALNEINKLEEKENKTDNKTKED